MALKPITVSQLNRYISRILATDPILGNVSVRGEISNLKYHGSGHIYFSLKDAGSKVSCFVPSSAAKSLRYELTDGLEVIVYGYLSVYEQGGYYSLNVRDVDVSGAGNLAAAFKALFTKLEKEGLFDEEYKKPLPEFPKKVCVITSQTGAAVRDILKIIRTRNHMVDVLVYPCLVQGNSAAQDIAEALHQVNLKFPDTDVIIVGRGGGSAEELWAFNEEIVARSIFDSKIPVISAVGHETDFSISDYAADRRAETPTAAAVMAVPDTAQMGRQAQEWMSQIGARMRLMFDVSESWLTSYRPEVFVRMLKDRVRSYENEISLKAGEMRQRMDSMMLSLTHEVEKQHIMLEAGSPERIIARGYAAVRISGGDTVSSAKNIREGQLLDILMKDGSLICEVKDVRESASGQK